MSLVVDNSVVLAWCMPDEADAFAEAVLSHVTAAGAVAPGIWWYELRNALLANERRGRITAADTRASLEDLAELRIRIDYSHDEHALLELARRHDLSVYDASYLELARRARLPLCTLDARLRRGAEAAEIELWRDA